MDFTWRERDPELLNSILDQKTRLICWSISIIRHLEVVYRLEGSLVRLSFQELLNSIPRNLIKKNGDLLELSGLANFVMTNGTVSEADNPFTGVVSRTAKVKENVGRWRPVRVTKHKYNGFSLSEFDTMLYKALQNSPFAARIIVANGFDGIQGDTIYKPEESDVFDGYGHMVLIVGCGRDESGQAQDSFGLKQGNNGFIRIARMDDVLTDYFEIEVETRSP